MEDEPNWPQVVIIFIEVAGLLTLIYLCSGGLK